MNGAMYGMSAVDLWMCAGAGFSYDSVFSSTVGGYPKGARVLAATGVGYWVSTTDNNVTDPDTGGAGWFLQGVAGANASVYASAQQVLATGNAKVLFDTVEFDTNTIYNTTSKRFIALYAGKYRVTGSVMLAAAGGQELATQIWHNGALAKQCFQAPQVSNGNLSMPFEAIINCAVSDYLEVYMTVPTTSVNAGQVGSNQAFVFAQCSYLGT